MTAGQPTPPATSPGGPARLLLAGAVLAVITGALVTPADADLWGHLRFGMDILASGNPIQQDRYSFASDQPWVNHEWLTEVILAVVYGAGGVHALIVMKLAVIAACLWIVWRHYRTALAPIGLSLFVLGLAFVGTYWRTHTLRPQLFSVLLMAILLTRLHAIERGRVRWLFAVPPLMALWVNLHGGWIVGGGVFGVWALARLADRQQPARTRVAIAATSVVSLAATLLSPDGVEMWRFLASTVRLGRDDIQEWSSILSSPVALGIPWLSIAATAAYAAWRAPTWRWDRVALAVLLGVASFRVSRLDAFFAMTVVVLWSDELIAAWPARARTTAAAASRAARAITAAAFTAMVLPVAQIATPYTSCLTMAGDWLPEPGAAEFVLDNRLQGRMLTWFDWGEYALWHFSPGIQVSFDGRRETVYSEAYIREHRRFYAGADPDLGLLARLDPQYIWLPHHLPVVRLLQQRGWVPIFTGPTSSIFAPPGTTPDRFRPVPARAAATRCFPGL